MSTRVVDGEVKQETYADIVARMTALEPACCPQCGEVGRFPGTVVWCPCNGWVA